MPVTNYIWDEVNDTLLMEKDEAGSTTAAYTYEPGQYGPLISQRRTGQTNYYHFDGQGSTRQLTDASASVTDSSTYTAFGESVAQSGTTMNPFGYKGALGYYANPETNDLYVRARNYLPIVARWISLDPQKSVFVVEGGYLYARNAPVSRVDPAGLAWDLVERFTEVTEREPTTDITKGAVKVDVGECECSCCGEFRWTIRWKKDWKKVTHVLQHVIATKEIFDCGDEKTKNRLTMVWGSSSLTADELRFYEAWGNDTLDFSDSFAGANWSRLGGTQGTRGKVEMIAKYAEVEGNPQHPLRKHHEDLGKIVGIETDATWEKEPPTVLPKKWIGDHIIKVKWDCCCPQAVRDVVLCQKGKWIPCQT